MSDIITGARASLWAGKYKIGYCTGVDVSQDIQVEAFEPLDTIDPAELVIVGMRYSVSAQFTRILNKTATATGLIVSPAKAKSGGTPISMQVQDSVSGKTLFSLLGVQATGRSTSIAARGMVSTSMQFQARTMVDEDGNPSEYGV